MKLLLIPTRLYIGITNSVAVFTSGIPVAARKFVINVATIILLCLGVLHFLNASIHPFTHVENDELIVGIITLTVLLIASIDRRIDYKRIQLNVSFWIGWFLCFGFMFGLSFIHPVNKAYYWWSVTSLLLFPLIFIVWNQREDMCQLYKTISRYAVVFSFLFLIINICVVPYMTRGDFRPSEGYVGMMAHPNHNGMICGAFYSAALYLLLVDLKHRYLYLISMGISIGFIVASTSRTTELGVILQTIGAVAFYYHSCKERHRKSIDYKKAFAYIALILSVAIITTAILEHLDKITLVSHAADVTSHDNQFLTRDIYKSINSLSSGRISLWKGYLSKTSFWGNGGTFGPVIEKRPDSIWAHNIAIDILYRSGVIACIGYFIWIISCLAFIMKRFRRGAKLQEESLFAIIVVLGYIAQAMLEAISFPMNTSITLIAYFGLIPMAFKKCVRE